MSLHYDSNRKRGEQMRPLLSICVPTFNRAEISYKTVQEHLSIASNRIEVIVCDNHSPDHTQKLLSAINDKRFKLFENDKNMGFSYNLMRVVKEASGHFVCIMSDEDTLNKDAIKQVLGWIEDFIENDMNIAAVVSNFHGNASIITKQDELMNVLYGRVSYISGLIINRDKLEDNDFIVTNNMYYPHIQLILKAGTRGRIIYSPLYLYKKTYEEHTTYVGDVENQKKDKKGYKETYVEPNSRLKQFEVESKMILELDINNNIKWMLLKKQYENKYIQGTIIYELIIRNESLLKNAAKGHIVSTEGMEEKFNKVYIDRVAEYMEEEYLQPTILEVNGITNYIQTVRQIRSDFDVLVNEKGYLGILVGSISFIQEKVNLLLDYSFNISYVCTEDLIEEEVGDRWLSIRDLEKFTKVVLVVDEEDSYYMEVLNNINVAEIHLFNMNDFKIHL
jgi:glycosyltransferase involved in cell wall biosynthesis